MDESEYRCWHEWPVSGSWGVILGVTRCKHCGKIAETADFPVLVARDATAPAADRGRL